jgi:hypothetical protein
MRSNVPARPPQRRFLHIHRTRLPPLMGSRPRTYPFSQNPGNTAQCLMKQTEIATAVDAHKSKQQTRTDDPTSSRQSETSHANQHEGKVSQQ